MLWNCNWGLYLKNKYSQTRCVVFGATALRKPHMQEKVGQAENRAKPSPSVVSV